MRALLLVVLVLVAGCVTTPSDAPPTATPTDPTAPTTEEPDANASAPMGERAAVAMEHFFLLANRSIAVMRPGTAVPAESSVPEAASGAAFYTGPATGVPLAPFVSSPFGVPFETTGEFDITMRFVASGPAVTTLPSGSGFPSVGAWFGTPERYAFFIGDATQPANLEAGQVYTATMRVPLPPGGFFVRAGESIAIVPYLNYQSVDGGTVGWVVGGETHSGFQMPHTHFNLSAPRATVILDESGETGPNPSPSGDQNPQPVDIPFSVPADALYIVLEVTGTPKAGPSVDMDASIRTGAGEVVGAGSSPFARETVVLGPSALASVGRELVAHVTSSSSASGGTFTVTVTAFSP